jgi:hypothetical protein
LEEACHIHISGSVHGNAPAVVIINHGANRAMKISLQPAEVRTV